MRRRKKTQIPKHAPPVPKPAHSTESAGHEESTIAQELKSQPPITTLWKRIPWFPFLLLGFVWAYACFWIYPPLLFDRAWKPFYFETAFFTKAVSQPGGLIGYVGALLSQLNQYAAAGALVTTLLVALLGLSAAKAVRFNGVIAILFAFIPGLGILVIQGRYAHGALETGLGVLLGVSAFLVWQRLKQSTAWGSVGICLAMSLLIYWVAGAIITFAFLLAASVAVTQWTRSFAHAWPYWLLTATALAIGIVGLPQVAKELTNGRPDAIALLARGLIFLYLPILGGFARKAPWRAVQPALMHVHNGGQPAHSNETINIKSASRNDWLVLAAVTVVTAVLLCATFDRRTRLLGAIELNALDYKWDSVLALARKLKTEPTPVARLAIARALYHTGKLQKELFSYPQRKGVEILPSLREGLEVCDLLADTMIELGQVNLAEHFAHESLELRGERPRTLWQLGRIYVLKDQPKVASVFLRRLSMVPFHKSKALKRLKAMETDPALASEPDIARVRPFRVTNDIADSGLPTEVIVKQCLGSNKRNRMAFEFMLAHYLLETNLEQVARNTEFLGDYGIWEMPRHIEEALVLHDSLATADQTASNRRRTSAAVAQRFELLRKTIRANNGKVQGIEDILTRDFGDTYWFYHMFGLTFGEQVKTYKISK